MQDVPLIPRALLFGNAERHGAKISPDGAWLAWIQPVGGIANIWLAPRGDMAAGCAITKATHRDITHCIWAYDSEHLLYHEDLDGDEQWQVFAVHRTSGAQRALTRKGARGLVAAVSDARPSSVAVTTFDRDPRFGDLQIIDLPSATATITERNDLGFTGYLLDDQFRAVFAVQKPQDGRNLVFAREEGGGWEVFLRFEAEDAMHSGLLGLSRDRRTLFLADSRERDTTAVVALDLQTGERTVIAEHDRADVHGFIGDLKTYEPIGYMLDLERRSVVALTSEFAASVQQLDQGNLGDWTLLSRSHDDRWWTVSGGLSTQPGRAYLFDRNTGAIDLLYDTRPQLDPLPMAPMTAITILASDGLPLVCYVTLPHGFSFDPISAQEHNLPTVLLVHGGPHARDSFGFNSEHQWLANRGYCVLSVNFRGSDGFGKRFLLAGDREWGRAMDRDLEECVDWLIARGIADPARLAIMGASYGGYAVLSALTQRPDRYACGVDVVGPSNLETLMQSIPPYWEAARAQFHRAIGDPQTDDGRALLQDRSPLHRAPSISRPLLIAQGERDPRVKVAESDQMAAALQAHGIPVLYLKFPHEGHGFSRPVNRLAFYSYAEMFLARWIGGRFEPQTGQDTASADIEVAAGREIIAALLAYHATTAT